MNKLIILLFFFPFFIFSQNNVEVNIHPQEYSKKLKKLELKIINKGFDFSGKIWVSDGYRNDMHLYDGYYANLWNQAFFEMNVPTGNLINKDDELYLEAKWEIRLTPQKGGFNGSILDLSQSGEVVLTFSSNTKVGVWQPVNEKKREDYKKYVKIIFNEIIKTVK